MTGNIFFSLLLTPVIIICLELYRRLEMQKEARSPDDDSIPISDLFVRFVYDCKIFEKIKISYFSFWFVASSLIGILLPLIGVLTKTIDTSALYYFSDKRGIITTITFSILVPFLFAAHFRLYSALRNFLSKEVLKNLGFDPILDKKGFGF